MKPTQMQVELVVLIADTDSDMCHLHECDPPSKHLSKSQSSKILYNVTHYIHATYNIYVRFEDELLVSSPYHLTCVATGEQLVHLLNVLQYELDDCYPILDSDLYFTTINCISYRFVRPRSTYLAQFFQMSNQEPKSTMKSHNSLPWWYMWPNREWWNIWILSAP